MKRILVLFLFIIIAVPGLSQSVDEVSLVVSGSGTSKDNAIQSALRSAVEQAYGVFVSANTQVLNDEVVKDEIATVSSGNIKSYKEIDCQMLNDSNWTVSLRAVVALNQLMSYAKSKGFSCEFAGQTFAMNMKLKELNRQNEVKAVNNLRDRVAMIAKDVFDVGVMAKDPMLSDNGTEYIVPLEISVTSNEAANAFYHLVTSTLSELSLTQTEIEDYERTNHEIYWFQVYDNLSFSRVRIASYDGYSFDQTYSYYYAFRDSQTLDIIEQLLRIPYRTIRCAVQSTNGVKDFPIPLSSMSYKVEHILRNYYYYPHGGCHPYFFLLKGISKNANQGVSDVYIKAIKRECPSPRANEALSWYTNDNGSPYTTWGVWGTSTTSEDGNESIKSVVSRNWAKIKGEMPLFTFPIRYRVYQDELMNLTGFSIIRTDDLVDENI